MKDIVFNPLDRDAELEVTERNLPHWFQIGAATFVTFRTGDSIPREVLLWWQRELELWLSNRRLPTRLAESVTGQSAVDHNQLLAQLDTKQRQEFKRLTDRLFHRSLDECHGRCMLRDPALAKIVADAMRFFDDNRYDLDRFIVMPNHVHVIVQFRSGGGLRTVSESWMRFTARQINRATGESGAFWQPEPFDHIIRSADQFAYLQRYIADNPKKANLPAGEYLYWERLS